VYLYFYIVIKIEGENSSFEAKHLTTLAKT